MINFNEAGDLEFYGKKISEMNENEVRLVMIDTKMLIHMECIKNGEVVKTDVNGEHGSFGIQSKLNDLSFDRVTLVSEILGLPNVSPILNLVVSEMSEYSFDGFCRNTLKYINGGKISNFKKLDVLDFEHKFSMN